MGELAQHPIQHRVEAASCSLLLGETRNAELAPSSMLDDRHDLNGEGNGLDVEGYGNKPLMLALSHIKLDRSVGNIGQLTVSGANASKHKIPLFVNLDVLDAKFLPGQEQFDNLRLALPLGYAEANVTHRRFNAEQSSQPVLLDFNLATTRVGVGPDINVRHVVSRCALQTLPFLLRHLVITL